LTITLLILTAVLLALIGAAGVVLTLFTLPGVWLTLIAALVCQWLWGDQGLMFSWWTLGTLAAIAFLGEILETVSSAVGTARSGGGRSGAIGSILGAIVGAIVGSMIVPLIGTIIGAVAGAGLGAVALERGITGRTWEQSLKIGRGAAGARAVALLIKTMIAAGVAVALVVAVFL
jgi:uncharacterized protein YqgC (DUF456 family)